MIPGFLKMLLGGQTHVDTSHDHDHSPADLDAIRAELTAMALPAIALSFDPGDRVGDNPHSSIGGAPSLSSPQAWPRQGDQPMMFLAQINYAEMPPLDGYPADGLLSIFVTDDDLNGCDFPSRNQKGFVTLYTPDPNDLIRVPSPTEHEYDPYGSALRRSGARLRATPSTGLPSSTTDVVDTILKNLGNE